MNDTGDPLSWMDSGEKALVIELVIDNRVKAGHLEKRWQKRQQRKIKPVWKKDDYPPGTFGIDDVHYSLVRMTPRCEWHDWKMMQDILPSDDKTLCRHAESSSSSASWLLAQQASTPNS